MSTVTVKLVTVVTCEIYYLANDYARMCLTH